MPKASRVSPTDSATAIGSTGTATSVQGREGGIDLACECRAERHHREAEVHFVFRRVWETVADAGAGELVDGLRQSTDDRGLLGPGHLAPAFHLQRLDFGGGVGAEWGRQHAAIIAAASKRPH